MSALDLGEESNYAYVQAQLKEMMEKGESEEVVGYIRSGVESEQFLHSE